MSVKITLQVLGSIGSAGTVTTGLVFGLPKLKTSLNSDVSDVTVVKSLDEIKDVATDTPSDIDSIDPTETTPTPPPKMCKSIKQL